MYRRSNSKRSLWAVIPALVFLINATTSWSQDGTEWVERRDYVVLVAEDTELQRFLEGRDSIQPCTHHLLLNGNSLCNSIKLLLDEFDWEQLAEDLVKITNEPQERSIQIRIYFAESPGTNARILRWTLDGFASSKLKFGRVRQTETHGTGLHESIGDARHPKPNTTKTPILEDAVGNEYVDVYPVRTFLSRLYTGGADCVVHVKPKFADDFGESLPRSIRTSMSVFTRKIKFVSKEKVVFVFHYSPGKGDEAKKWFFEEGVAEMTDVLGFQDWSVTTKYE